VNLDRALETLRDLPTDEVIEVGEALQGDYFRAKERYERIRNEITRRMDETEAEMLVGESRCVEAKWTNQYEWDMGAVMMDAPDHVVYREEQVVPAHYVVRNTTALNNLIRKLGQSDKAGKLRNARSVKRSNPRLTFAPVIDSREEATCA